tara:strand:+ start:36 stop:950 length:915 start_codon:yes stop_codon:yes gene_type:complete
MATSNIPLTELFKRLRIYSTEAKPTSMSEDPSIAKRTYKQYEELPLLQQLGLAVAPGTGNVIAAYETPMFAKEAREAAEEGNIPRAAGQGALTGLSALSMIPGLGLGIRGIKAGVKAATKGLRKFAPEDIPTRWYRGTANIGELSSPAKWKTGKEGVFGGGGIYVTPDPKYASSFATENVLGKPITGGFVTPLDVTFENPLIVSMSKTAGSSPEIKVLEHLGVSTRKAEDMVEKAFESKGGLTTEVKSRAIKQGYDSIILERDGIVQEAISYNPKKNIISAITKNKQGGSIMERNPYIYNMRAI